MHIEKNKMKMHTKYLGTAIYWVEQCMMNLILFPGMSIYIGVEVLKCRNINEIPKLQFEHSMERERDG